MLSRISRRNFLMTSAALTGSAAAVGAVSDRPLRTGVVGTGDRGRELSHHLLTVEGVELQAVCDTYAPHLAKGVEVAGGARAYERFDDMLQNADLDAVIVATPPRDQCAVCTAAIKQNLAVYCESPMGFNVADAQQLTALAEEKAVVFQAGLQRRASAVYEQAEAMVRAGLLGDIVSASCRWHTNGDDRRPVPADPETAEYDELDRQLNWRLYRETSQGLMAERGVHQLDVVNRMLGTTPKNVLAGGGVDYWKDGRDNHDHIYAIYEYEIDSRTVRARYTAIQTNSHEGVNELILGTKGTLLLAPQLGLFYREDRKQSDIDGVSGATEHVPNSPWAHRGGSTEIVGQGDNTRAALVAFVEAARSGNTKTICTARMGLEALSTALMANEAIETDARATYPEIS
jgi:predicted dehydrogenase